MCRNTAEIKKVEIIERIVFEKDEIYDLIWNEPYYGDYNVIMRHIRNIREKIEDNPAQPIYIQTVRGVGYRFNGNLGSK